MHLFGGTQTCDPPITYSIYAKTNVCKMSWRCGAISSLVLTNHLQTYHPYWFFERRCFEPTLSMDFRWLIRVKIKNRGRVSQSINQSICQLMILLIMNSLINDSTEKTLSLRPFTQPHLACFCNRFVVGHFNAVYSSNMIGRLRVFVSSESFLQVW